MTDERDEIIRKLRAELKVCWNELCLRCGEYKRDIRAPAMAAGGSGRWRPNDLPEV